jgi:putative transposase
MLSYTALAQRSTAWQHCPVALTRLQQEADLQDLRAAFPVYAALHRHVLQDVLARRDKAYQARFRHMRAGEPPGYPRCQGRSRSHSFTHKEEGNGARLEHGLLVLATIGRITIHWARPFAGAQDGHQLPRGGRVVGLLLVHRGAHPPMAVHWERAGH